MSHFPKLHACALCGSTAPLQSSHIMPKFAIRLLRGSSGGFVEAKRVRRRLQDGTKVDLLCSACEGRFASWEHQAKNQLFSPLAGASCPFRYGAWLYLFSTSLTWRALTYLKFVSWDEFADQAPAVASLTPTLDEMYVDSADAALLEWKQALLGPASSHERHPQHLVLLNGRNVPHEHPGVVGFTAYNTDAATAIACQIGPVMFLGMIRHSENDWGGTRLSALGGVLGVEKQEVPTSFAKWLADYFSAMNALVPRADHS